MADAEQPKLHTVKLQNHTNFNVKVKISSQTEHMGKSLLSLRPNEEREYVQNASFTLVHTATGVEEKMTLSIDEIEVEIEDNRRTHMELRAPFEGVQSSSDNCLFEITDNEIRSLGPYTNQVEKKEVLVGPNFREWQETAGAKDRAVYKAEVKNLTNFNVNLTMHSYNFYGASGNGPSLLKPNHTMTMSGSGYSSVDAENEGEPKCNVYLTTTTTDPDGRIRKHYTFPIDAFEVQKENGSGSRLVLKAPFEVPKGLNSTLIFPVLSTKDDPDVTWLFHIDEHEIRTVGPRR